MEARLRAEGRRADRAPTSARAGSGLWGFVVGCAGGGVLLAVFLVVMQGHA